jgi:TRAP-type mannitol/chloroaromatic compound transport system permease small subunit
MNSLLAVSNGIDRQLRWIASASGWLLVVLTGVTCFDVICRKFAIPIPFTKFQELEWHLHTAIFSFWLGFNYTINAHPRVDSYVENMSQHKRAWIELAGCFIFALPYVLIVMYYGWPFVSISSGQRVLESANGLPIAGSSRHALCRLPCCSPRS